MAQCGQPDVFVSVGLCCGGVRQVGETGPDVCLTRQRSILALFLDADLLGLGALDRAASGQALVAQHAQGFNFRTLASHFAVFQHLDVAGAGLAVLVNRFLALWHGAPKHQQFANVLNWRGVEFVGQGLKHGLTGSAVVRENANFDKSVRVQRGIGFFFNGGGQAITTDHHDGVEVMGFGAVFFTLGGGQLNLRHTAIIGHEGKNES